MSQELGKSGESRIWKCLAVTLPALALGAPPAPYTTWSDYSGAADSMQYSALKQIDKSNVHKLCAVWSASRRPVQPEGFRSARS